MDKIKTELGLAVNINKAAAVTGIGTALLRSLCASGKLPHLQVGTKILIRTDTLNKFLKVNEGKNLKETDTIISLADVEEETETAQA